MGAASRLSGRRRPVQFAALVLVGVLLPLTVLAVTTSSPTDGAVTDVARPGWGRDGVIVTAVFGRPGGLQVGDRVVSVGGTTLTDRLGGTPLTGVRPGDRITYRVVRAGPTGPRTADVEVTVQRFPDLQVLRRLAPELPLMVVTFGLYSFVLWHRPRDPTARTLFAMGVLLPLSQAAAPLGVQVLDLARGRWWPYLASDVGNLALWGTLLRIALIFPSPSALVSRHPWLLQAAQLIPIAVAAPLAVAALDPAADPLRRVGLLAGLSVPAANLVPYLAGLALTTRYFTAPDALTRRRMRWAVATLLLASALYLGLGQLPMRLIGHPLVPWAWQGLFLLPCPIAVGAAVLRHRLFDIEVVLRRSLIYGGLTLALVLVYVGTVTVLGRLLGARDLTSMIAAGLAVALFQPLRDRLRRTVSRVVFGNRDDPAEVLHRLGDQVEAAGAAPDALPHLVTTLAETLRLSFASVELAADPALTASTGRLTGMPMTIPLTDRGEEIGRLVLDPGAGREPFGHRDRRLLEGLARQVTVLAQNLVLTHRLQRSVGRTVTALEEQRRRLRRDIHDGLGPTLASATLRVDLARRLVRSDPDRAEQILVGLADTQRQAIREIRSLVEGLRPAALDQLGLVAALREQADRFTRESAGALTAQVTADDDLAGLPAAVEVAAYRIASEALTNVVRHAGASHCEVTLRWLGAPGLELRVRDDGRGLVEGFRAGVGLTSIRERVAELGGQLQVGPGPGSGTLLVAQLPSPGDGPGVAAGPEPVTGWSSPDRLQRVRGGPMTEPGPIRRPEPAASPWTDDPEVPEADAVEQRRDVLDDPGDIDPETVVGRDRTDRLAEPPLEVNEADLADQLVDVPFDDDLDRG